MVLAAETGGRWSDETAHFFRSLAKAKAEPSEGRVVEEVELHLGVQRREGLRSISPGQAPQPWHGGLHPSVNEVLPEDRFA